MALNKKHKNLLLLFGIGVACLLYGVGISFVENCFSILTTVIFLIGLASILVCFSESKKGAQRPIRVYQWKKYGFIVLAVVLFLFLFVGINYLSCKYNLRWDATKAKQHTLTESTAAFIEGLEREVKIIAFYVGMPPKYLEDLFGESERLSKGKIETEIIDPIVRIGYAAHFGSVISGK